MTAAKPWHNRRDYALGTYLDQQSPYGFYVGGRALCSDGRTRALKRIAATADTFFSVPASITAYGKTIGGYVTVETVAGWSTPTDDDPAVVKFQPYVFSKNGAVLPRWTRQTKFLGTEIRRVNGTWEPIEGNDNE